jgi:nitroreductase
MSGFEVTKISQEFGLASTELLVVLVVVGYPETLGSLPQKPRKPLSEVLTLV